MTGVQALLFDVDGTMADTEEAHRVAFNLAFRRCRLDWTWERAEYRELLKVNGGKERLEAYIGKLALPYQRRVTLLDAIPEIHAEKTRFYSTVVRDGAVPLRNGIARLLQEAQDAGCKLAIVSTTTAANIDALLEATMGAAGRARFSTIACGDEVPAKKPAPDIYLRALKNLGIEPANAIAFEDSANGLRAALAAGIWTVVTPNYWTEGGDFAGAGLLLPDLGDPSAPLAGEPGRQLRDAPWLSFAELKRLAGGVPAQRA